MLLQQVLLCVPDEPVVTYHFGLKLSSLEIPIFEVVI